MSALQELRSPVVAATLALWFAFPTSPAFAESASTQPHASSDTQSAQIAEARTRFNRGLELYRDGDLPSALAEFRRADALAPSYRLKYNIGQVCEEEHDYACALSAFQAYLDGGGAEIPRARRASVELEVQKISASVAELNVTVDVADAEVTIDDVPVGVSPLTVAIKINSGLRRVAARQGALFATRSVEVAGGERLNVALTLRAGLGSQPAAMPEPNTGKRPTNAVDRSSARSLALLSWVGTGIFASGSAITGALALHASHQLATERRSYPVSSAELGQSSDRVAHFALAADILGALAVGGAGCALYFTVAPVAMNAHADGAIVSIHSQF
jgi:hypothetical protein